MKKLPKEEISFWFFRILYCSLLCHIDIFIYLKSRHEKWKSLAVLQKGNVLWELGKILRLSDVGNSAINKIESGIKFDKNVSWC